MSTEPTIAATNDDLLGRRELLLRGGGAALSIGALGTLLAACGDSDEKGGGGAAPAKIGGQISALAWGSYVDDKVAAPFLTENGAKVKNSTLSSNDEIITKMKAGGVGKVDLISPNAVYIPQFVAADIVQPIDIEKVPNLKLVLPAIDKTVREAAEINGKLYAVPYLWGYDGMVYNSTRIPTPPTSWRDVLKPEYKGKIVLGDGPNANFEIWPRVLGYDPATMTKDQLDATVDFLVKLKKTQVRAIVADQNDQIELMRNGEAWIIASGSFAGLPTLAQGRKGDKLAVTVPKEGGASWIDSWAIGKDAPNAATALAYVNYMIGAQAQAKLATSLTEATVNSKAVDLLAAKDRKLFPYDSTSIGTGRYPLFKLPSGDPKYATVDDWSEAWQRVSAA
jgi:spermidine/putrescine transport system substrate-binding protein